VQLTTLRDVLQWAEQSFEAANLYFGHGTNNAWDEAVALALFVLQIPPDSDTSILDRVMSPSEREKLIALVNRRIQERIPVPYLTHEAWFMGLKFYVDKRVIIPRSPMGELILNGFEPWLGNRPVRRILDLCTGSGCIAIACAKIFSQATVDAVDISKDALSVAAQNIQLHACQNQVNLIHADLFEGCAGQQYDIIISNPPYVDTDEMEALPLEFHFEPSLALEAGSDGLMVVKRILKEASYYLSSSGLLFVEVGNAMEALQAHYPKVPFTWLEFERGGQGVFMLEKEKITGA